MESENSTLQSKQLHKSRKYENELALYCKSLPWRGPKNKELEFLADRLLICNPDDVEERDEILTEIADELCGYPSIDETSGYWSFTEPEALEVAYELYTYEISGNLSGDRDIMCDYIFFSLFDHPRMNLSRK